MTSRPAVDALLGELYPGAAIEPLTPDASDRRFLRVRPASGRTVVVMDYGEPFEGETDDMVMTRIFRAAALPVAELIGAHPAAGCLVLQDLGDRRLAAELQAGFSRTTDDPPALLVHAVDLAAAVAARGSTVLEGSERADGPALDERRFRFEMEYFVTHYVRGLLGREAAPDGLEAALDDLARGAALTPRRVLCHRDFHGRNLLLDERDAPWMVDIQDARWGPDAYDLASLLYDAYVDTRPAWSAPLVERYLAGLDDPPSEGDFVSRLHQVAAQRMIKALGTFGYQVAVRGRREYLAGVPRTLDRLRALLPELTETHRLERLLDRHGLLDPPAAPPPAA